MHPTSAGSQMYVFPLNCWASVVTPFLIENHRNEQGIVAVISRELYVLITTTELDSIISGYCLT